MNYNKSIQTEQNQALLSVNIENGQIKLDNKIYQPITKDDCYRTALREFLSSIERKCVPWTTLEEGYKTLKIIKTAYQIAGFDKKMELAFI